MINLRVASFALRSLYGLARLILYGLIVGVIGFGAVALALRYWLLPSIEEYREPIAAAISRAAGQKVTIGAVRAEWDGVRPRLELRDVRVFDRQDRLALTLGRIENTLSWTSLLYGEPRFYTMEIDRPALDVWRDRRGVMHVAGIALDSSEETGFSDWLLRQPNIMVAGASVRWRDEMRGTPALDLASVNLRMENRGKRHRFGLQAVPPAHLAAPLDLRGDLSGRSISEPGQWRGELFARLDYADFAAWGSWISLPLGLTQGRGAARVWAGIEGGKLTGLTADLALAEVKAKLAPDLPEIDTMRLQGRMGWKSVDGGFEFHARDLTLVTRDAPALRLADFLLRLIPGKGAKLPRGELRAKVLELEPLLKLSAYLPLDATVRERLTRIGPRGSVYDMVAKWEGAWPAPSEYAIKGRFAGLGIHAYGAIPAFSGMSGSLDGDQTGGAFNLNSRNATLELPKVFRDPLVFDTLTAQSGWVYRDGHAELKFSNVSFSNPHLAGSVYGVYRTAPGSPGLIDLTGSLTRADARFVGRYIPLVVNAETRDWLDRAILSGSSGDVRLRVKGNLADFPFADGSRGIFQVTAKVSGGTLLYAGGWPKIENLVADLTFRGARMEIAAQQGALYGAKLAKVRAVIPDMLHHDEILEVEGEARGPTLDFLKFIETSPVGDHIDRFTDGMRANGPGKLDLKLRIPLRRIHDTKMTGAYQFTNNQLIPGPDLPTLDQVSGQLEFSETAVNAQNISARMLGGRASLNVATQKDGGVRIGIAGWLDADGLHKTLGWSWLKSLRGGADWRGVITVRKRLAQLTLDTSLAGLASELPAPFAKVAGETAPLHFERSVLNPRQDMIVFSYGKVVSARLLREKTGERMKTERGAISFGATAALPSKNGVWVSGVLPVLDLDGWRNAFSQDSAAPLLELAGVELRIGALDFFGRRFSELFVSGVHQSDAWRSTLRGREIVGEVEWSSQGKGKVMARLKSLAIPAAFDPSGGSGRALEGAPKALEKDLPGLDVVAESFTLKDKPLGRLELMALPEGGDWRMERLKISNPESVLQADGLWQGWLTSPRTRMNLKLEAMDVGKLLARLGFPEGVKRGNGKLEGVLSWSGSPQSPDYASLAGNVTVEAKNGQFAKMDPGLGKLLGILSLQALPRRIVLDFRDVFSEGFEFNSITGKFKITGGVAHTQDLTIAGSAAKVGMKGDIDLARETQNLRVRVAPALGQGVGLASFIGGPVVGITTLIVNKVLQDPLDQIVAYEYNVTGTWSDPVVSKIGSPPQQSEPK